MSDITLEEVIEEVKTLPPDQREKIRELVQLFTVLFPAGAAVDIMKKTLTLMPDDMRRLRDALNGVTVETAGREGRAEVARAIRGKYAHLPTSSEAFAARKAEEIALEDRRSRP
ncbi:MAG TPA: hypothetical protein VN228_12410 [Pyrinomonadaceae bacterium]|nr:hypothetical protein [Pyrinomonadaceae bacterium]